MKALLLDGLFKYGETVAIDVEGTLYKRKVHYALESGNYVNIGNEKIYESEIAMPQKKYDHNAYVQSYIRDKRDKISVLAPKGTKDNWKKTAADLGMSMNAFIIYCVEKEIHGEN